MRVLLAEDDEELAKELAGSLRLERFAVDVVGDGVEATHLGLTERYDAALLDMGFPPDDGLSILGKWRSAGSTLPVLILTARSSWSDKSAGFVAGADDYLVKPFLPGGGCCSTSGLDPSRQRPFNEPRRMRAIVVRRPIWRIHVSRTASGVDRLRMAAAVRTNAAA